MSRLYENLYTLMIDGCILCENSTRNVGGSQGSAENISLAVS